MFETAEEKKERLAEISRANGSKSRGPVTEEGKQRSRMNRLTHGLYATTRLLLEDEQAEEYEECRLALHDHFRPQNAAEERLVEFIASAMWRLDRVPSQERQLLAESESLQHAFASSGMASLQRQFSALERSVDRAIRRLGEMQRLRSGQSRSRTPVQDALRGRSANGIYGTNPAALAAAPVERRSDESVHREKNCGTNPEPARARLSFGEVEIAERTQPASESNLSRKERRALERSKRREAGPGGPA